MSEDGFDAKVRYSANFVTQLVGVFEVPPLTAATRLELATEAADLIDKILLHEEPADEVSMLRAIVARLGEPSSEQTAILLREVFGLYNAAECVGPIRSDIARITEIGRMLSPPWIPSWERPASDWDAATRYRAFCELRDELVNARVCLACGWQTAPHERPCQCENDE